MISTWKDWVWRRQERRPCGALTSGPDRLLKVAQALRMGFDHETVHAFSKYDPWFISRLQEIVDLEARVKAHGLPTSARQMQVLKSFGFSDARLAKLSGQTEADVRSLRHDLGVTPVFKRIDTCAAEFASPTAYMYSTYETGLALTESGDAACPRAIAADGSREDHHPRRRSQPHRPGDRVRLLLLSCLLLAHRSRLRDHHGQLQSGDGLDRL